MKVSYISYVILSFYLLFSCTQVEKVENHEIVSFVRSDFSYESVLAADTIDFDNPLLPKWFHVVRDTIVFVTNWGKNDPILELYHLGTKELLGFGAAKGRGPGEYLAVHPDFNYGPDTVAIYDPVMFTFSLLHVDSLIKNGAHTVPLVKYKLPEFINFPALVDSNRLVGWNFLSFKSKDIDNGFDRLFLIDFSVDQQRAIKTDEDFYNAINYSLGHTIVNREKGRIVVADEMNASIYIYNMALELTKELKGPDMFEIEYLIDHIDKRIRPVENKRYLTYFQLSYTSDAVYLLYIGAIGVVGFPTDHPVEVFKISWEGDLLHRYQLDQTVVAISVDSKEEYLYATGYRGPNEPGLFLRYRLK